MSSTTREESSGVNADAGSEATSTREYGNTDLATLQRELRRLREANIALRRYKSTVQKERKRETDQTTVMMADLEAKECVP
jgi:hypothetical protein